MTKKRQNRVFLSYASEDLEIVRKVNDGLIKRELEVWFDKEHLGPGKYKPQITRAITKSRYFVICISNAAMRKTGDKPGFQDEELNEAYEIAKNEPESEFAIIPVRLEECDRGDHRLSMQQQYDLFDDFDKGLDKLAVDMGGISLSDAMAKDERTDDEKLTDSLFHRATAEYYAGNIKESLYLVNSILVYSTDFDGVWNSKGILLGKLGKPEEAIVANDKALEIIPDFAEAWSNKGAVLYDLGQFNEAVETFDKALEINPDLAVAWQNKGNAIIRLGKPEGAIEAYNKALDFNPENKNAL